FIVFRLKLDQHILVAAKIDHHRVGVDGTPILQTNDLRVVFLLVPHHDRHATGHVYPQGHAPGGWAVDATVHQQRVTHHPPLAPSHVIDDWNVHGEPPQIHIFLVLRPP